jgi:hypothetical protein
MSEKGFLVVAIGFLSSVTLNRGIHMYYKEEHDAIQTKKDNLYRNSEIIINSHGSGKISNNSERKELEDEEKKMRIKHFRVHLIGSILTMIVGSIIPNMIIKIGIMFGGVLNLFYSSMTSWYFLEEAEKFGISAFGLGLLLTFVMYRYK